MAQDFQAGIQDSQIRGWILRILERSYPSGMNKDTLKKQLNGIGYDVSSIDVERAVAYLDEKDCVEVETVRSAGFDRKTVKVTVKGIDVLQGAVDEPLGIDV